MDRNKALDKKGPPEDHNDGDFSMMRRAVSITPVVVALVTLLVVLFLLVSYYRVLASCYKSWILRNSPQEQNSAAETEEGNQEQQQQQQQQQTGLLIRSSALSKSLIQRLPVHKSSKSKRQTSDCAVCLGDFQEGEDVKVLPKCGHGFHVECIDTWLSIHSSICPLCRAKVEDPAVVVVIDVSVTQDPATEDGPAPEDQTAAAAAAAATGGRRKSSSLEEGSALFRSLFARLSRAAPDQSSIASLPSSSAAVAPPTSSQSSRMGRSWSSSRVFSIRRARQQEQQQQQQQDSFRPC